ncbi:hypothetical protein LZQ00_07630 [Sphingobacterium sp. SRCM116780]|uniref:hypothetical protein n=1 Tax=Sphingobacterium sp. SRCM116780 TaxID=2907623 RepID=UPI001F2DAFAD|nr:hypothetical protein [Sphingobacterium sp. SRCM116780]UIR57680.1 hypothetical protein LZQ00_07630 [Sphingobacterium sp. SRCM116780]
MSWDVIAFKFNRDLKDVSEIDENTIEDIGTWDFVLGLIKEQFADLEISDFWCCIRRKDIFEIQFSIDELTEITNCIIFHLYGEIALYSIADLCKKNNWQLLDTTLGVLLDLDNLQKNGYNKFNQLRGRIT